jgi:hypothetical protein
MNVPGVRKLVKKHCGFDPVKAKKGRDWDHAFATFRSTEQRDAAVKALNGVVLRTVTLDVQIAEARKDPMSHPDSRKRRRVDRDADGGGGGFVVDPSIPPTPEELSGRLSDKVTPLWQMPYEDQLTLKKETIRKKLKEVFREKGLRTLPWVINGSADSPQGLPCAFEDVQPSPVTEGYTRYHSPPCTPFCGLPCPS